MNVLEKKPKGAYHDTLRKIIKLLTFNSPLELKGSSSLSSQQYFGDYDLFVLEDPDKNEFVSFINDVIQKMNDNPDLYFIELKFQDKYGKKMRIYPNGQVGSPFKWEDLDFIKLDLIARIDSIFTEISVIYGINIPDAKNYRKSIEDDIIDLKKEGKYYKILKRKFNLAKLDNNREELLRLSGIFNGNLGKMYQIISNIEAIKTVEKYYNDPDTEKKIKVNLKDIKVDNPYQFLSTETKKINNEAKKLQ